ncbi:MAG: thiamine phosphate synthase [Flavobacteriales bacterium]|nr:thiamine phosphate synthase [Flavobacteriales bacterium]
MIVVIAPEQDIPNEIEILHELFQSGLAYYHLRKPHKDYEGYCAYLNQIDEQYHNRVVVHQYHELVNEYNLKGIHFREQERRKLKSLKVESHKVQIEEYLNNFPTFDFQLSTAIVSSSFHEMEELEQCNFEFDYVFLSPVFDSISKKGYEGRGFDVKDLSQKVIGLGGVSSENINQLGELGYAGAAVLGTIWNSNDPVNTFKTLNIR